MFSKSRQEKLLSIITKQLLTINQDIHIRDIFIYPLSHQHSFGEHDQPTPNETRITRLTKHINILATIANKYHQILNCDAVKTPGSPNSEFKIKDDCRNKITRILLNEFSLYTSEPLTLHESSLLYSNIQNIASQQLPNVHLLLSSIPVVTNDGTLLNITCYVQCGTKPELKTFSKATPSHLDILYQSTHHFVQQSLTAKPTFASNFIMSGSGELISSDSVFIVTTFGEAKYIQAIDVCLDHDLSHSKNLVEALSKSSALGRLPTMPSQVDHIVTSNSILINSNSLITSVATHIDPNVDIAARMDYDIITKNDLTDLTAIYPEIIIKDVHNKLTIENPPFGFSYTVVASNERKLGHIIENLKDKIIQNNTEIQNSFIELQTHSKPVKTPSKRILDSSEDSSIQPPAKRRKVDKVDDTQPANNNCSHQTSSMSDQYFSDEYLFGYQPEINPTSPSTSSHTIISNNFDASTAKITDLNEIIPQFSDTIITDEFVCHPSEPEPLDPTLLQDYTSIYEFNI